MERRKHPFVWAKAPEQILGRTTLGPHSAPFMLSFSVKIVHTSCGRIDTMGLTIELVATPDPQPELDLGLPPRVRTRKPRRPRGPSPVMQAVSEFHVSFNLPVATRPQGHVGDELALLRVELLREEFEEFKDAVEREDIVAIADALGDIVYVAYGAALTYGIDLDAVLSEIHRSNMSKLGPDGRPLMRDDGKVLKPATYSAPDIRNLLLDQPPLFVD